MDEKDPLYMPLNSGSLNRGQHQRNPIGIMGEQVSPYMNLNKILE